MRFKLPLIAVMVGALSLSACGGGGSSSSGSTPTADNPASLVITDAKVGTGATVTAGVSATITYKTYLYKVGATDSKGTLIDPGTNPLTFTVGAGRLIAGVETGIIGMKVGGQRTLLIPANLAYGSTASATVPANSGLVFDMTLTAVN